jgi:hypothetical protein
VSPWLAELSRATEILFDLFELFAFQSKRAFCILESLAHLLILGDFRFEFG